MVLESDYLVSGIILQNAIYLTLVSRRNVKAPAFWDDVKPSQIATRPVWMTFDDEWVDEVRRGLKACRVFLWFPIYCKYSFSVCMMIY